MNQLVNHRTCPLPPYIILTCVMSFFPLVTFLRLPVLLKTALILPMAVVFLVVIEWTHKSLFLCFDSKIGSHVPLHLIAVVVIGHFVLVVLTHGRQVEWTARLDFLWNLQVSLLSLSWTQCDYVCCSIMLPDSRRLSAERERRHENLLSRSYRIILSESFYSPEDGFASEENSRRCAFAVNMLHVPAPSVFVCVYTCV